MPEAPTWDETTEIETPTNSVPRWEDTTPDEPTWESSTPVSESEPEERPFERLPPEPRAPIPDGVRMATPEEIAAYQPRPLRELTPDEQSRLGYTAPGRVMPSTEERSKMGGFERGVENLKDYRDYIAQLAKKPTQAIVPLTKLAPSAQTVQDAFDVIRAAEMQVGASETGEEVADTAQELIERPSVPPTPEAQIAAGAIKAGLAIPETMTSPLGVATLGQGALPAAASRVISGAFAADMASHLPEQARAAGTASVVGTPGQKTEAFSNLGIGGLMALGAARHAIETPPPAPPAPPIVPRGTFEKPPRIVTGDETPEITALDRQSGTPVPAPIPPKIKAAIEKAAEIGLNKSAAALSGAPISKDLPQQLETPIEKGKLDASEVTIPTEIHGDVRAQPGAGAGEVPAKVSVEGIQPREEPSGDGARVEEKAPALSDVKTTEQAWDYGRSQNTPEGIAALEKAQTEMQARMEAIKADPNLPPMEKLNQRVTLAPKAQFIREALEAARGDRDKPAMTAHFEKKAAQKPAPENQPIPKPALEEVRGYTPALKLEDGRILKADPNEGHGELQALYPEEKNVTRGFINQKTGKFLTTLEVARENMAGGTAVPEPAAKPTTPAASEVPPVVPAPPVEPVAPTKPLTPAAQRKAAAAAFTKRLKEYGEQLGFIKRPDDVHGWIGGKSGQGGPHAKIRHDMEMARAKQAAIKAFDGDVDKPDFAALGAKLEERIAAYEAEQAKAREADMGVETPLTGKESTDFIPPGEEPPAAYDPNQPNRPKPTMPTEPDFTRTYPKPKEPAPAVPKPEPKPAQPAEPAKPKGLERMTPREALQQPESEPYGVMRAQLAAARAAIAEGRPVHGEIVRSYEIIPELLKSKQAYSYDPATDTFNPTGERAKLPSKAWSIIAKLDALDIAQKTEGETARISDARRKATGELAKLLKFEPEAPEAPSTPVSPPANAAAPVPKLAPGEKGTGDLFKGEDQPFNLAGEKGVDLERVAAEKAAAEQREAEAKAAQEKAQPALPGVNEGELGELGMGAAKYGEVTARGGGNPTAMKYRTIDAERQQRGLPPLAKPQSVADQAVMDRAMAAIDNDPSLPERLVDELNNNPRAIEDWENHVLLLRKIDLRHEYEKSAREAALAYDDGRLDDMNDANARTGNWSQKLSELEHASRVSGSARGRALRALRVMANEDMSLAALEMQARADKGGAPITAAERAELIKTAEEYKSKAEAEAKYAAEKDQRIAELEAKEKIAEIQRQAAAAKAPSAAIIKIAESLVAKLDVRADAARQRLKDRMKRTSGMFGGVDPTVLIDLAEIGASHIGHIGLDFAKWSDAMIADVGDWIKPHLVEAWDASQKSLDSLKAPDAAKNVFKRTRDTVADITAKIKAKMDAAQAKLSIGEESAPDITGLVQKLARQFVEQGVRDRDALIDAVHHELQTIAPDMTRRDTMDAISGYGKFKQLSKDEIDVALRDLKGQMQQIGKLQDMEAGEAPSKTGVERRTPSDEERRLIQQVEAAKKKGGYNVTDPATQLKSSLGAIKTRLRNQIADLEHQISTNKQIVKEQRTPPTDAEADALRARRDELKADYEAIFGKKELTDQQRIDAAMKAVQKSIEEYDRRITAGELTPAKKVSKTPETPELLAARAWREALREHLKELRDLANPKKTKEQIALQGFKTRTAKRIAEMRDQIASGDFATKPKRKIVMDAEANRLQAEKEQVQIDHERAREKKLWQKMNVFQKGVRTTANAYDMARLLMTTGEFSFVLRQGKFNLLSHPIRTAKAIPDAIRAMRNETRARAIELEIFNDPEFPASQADKLAIVNENAPLSRQEELIMGRWSNVVPGVAAFNRAARVFLNKVRFDTWKAMRHAAGESLGKDGGKAIATYVNESTGRGGLGKHGEPAAVFLSRFMFSPRYLASRIQYATGHSLFMMPGSIGVKKVIAKEYARTLIGLGLYYTMLNWYFTKDGKKPTVETDARSSDFGKVKVGETRIDPLAGVAQIATFGKRSWTGELKNLKGEVYPIRQKIVKNELGEVMPSRGRVPYGKPDWTDVAKNFARTKAHPVPGAIANLLSGTDLVGNVVTPEGETLKLAAPLTYVDIYQALKEQDLSDGAAMSLLAFLGEGLQTHKPKK